MLILGWAVALLWAQQFSLCFLVLDAAPPLHHEMKFNDEHAINIGYTICGTERKEEFLTSLKSFHLFANEARKTEPAFFHVHIISDKSVREEDLQFLQPPSHFRATVYGRFMNLDNTEDRFALCAMERVYMHENEAFHSVQKMLYVDVDTLWLDDPREWWALFQSMDAANALFGMVEEAHHNHGWYMQRRDLPDHVPFFGKDTGKTGLNSGSMMMHLGRMRESNFSAVRDAIIEEYGPKGQLRLGDQDILNVYGYRYPDTIYLVPCRFNYRHEFGCEVGYPVILHGNGRKKDHRMGDTATFRHIYDVVAALYN